MNLSVNTLPETLSQGPAPPTENVGQQHFSRMVRLCRVVIREMKTK
jgi:hypothetical protein